MEASDFATAAREFQTADDLAQNPVVLRWAIIAATDGNDAVLAMNLVLRAEGRSADMDAELSSAVAAARHRFVAKLGILLVLCAPDQPCTARIDGIASAVGQRRYVVPGRHVVEIFVGTRAQRHTATVQAQYQVEVKAAPLSPSSGNPEAETVSTDTSRGVHPAWITVGGMATAALGGVTVWSAVDAKDKYESYLLTRKRVGYDTGRAAELRTNILFGATLGSAAAAILFAAFGVDYSSQASPAVALDLAGSDATATLTLQGAF